MATLPASAISLFHYDNNLDDDLGNSIVVNNGASLSSTKSKFGSKSLYFNGTSTSGNYTVITTPNVSQYTVALWIYITAKGASSGPKWSPNPVETWYVDDTLGAYIHISNGGSYRPVYGVVWNQQEGAYYETPINTWLHVAITRNGTQHKFYVNGSLKKTITNGSTAALKNIWLGAFMFLENGTQIGSYYKGFINELLVTSDVLWTADFTPPTSAYETTPAFNPANAGAKIKQWYFGGR